MATQPLPTPELVRPFVALANTDLTMREVAMLGIIAEHPDVSVREVAATIRIAKPVVTRGCQKMEARGLLSRQAQTTDSRLVRLRATAEGRELLLKLGGA